MTLMTSYFPYTSINYDKSYVSINCGNTIGIHTDFVVKCRLNAG